MESSTVSENAEEAKCSQWGDDEKNSDYNLALEKLKRHLITNKITYRCLEDTAKLINSVPGATVRLPTTKYSLLRAFMASSSLTHINYIYCNKCKKYVKCSPDESISICECSTKLKKTAKNYFVYIHLETQLKRILDQHWGKIVSYNNKIQSDKCENIQDTYSTTYIRKELQRKSNILSLMVNSDGVNIRSSGGKSIWPIQIICNFLPPQIRYQNQNILCVAFYYQDVKPDMLKYCEPFAEEVDHLQTHGFVFRDEVFRIAITCVVLDLPTRASFQQITQYNGYFACPYCLHEGEYTTKGVRYTYHDEPDNIRLNEQILQIMRDISEEKLKLKDGILGISPAVSFDHFDMVKSFGLDYMHCVCLGVTKAMHMFWMDSKNNHDSYINPAKRKNLDKRILTIKPCTFISRKPRSLKYIVKFKASEFRSLLLFYSPVVLRGILKDKYLDHFILLSGSIYKLLTTNISNNDFDIAEKKLEKFVREYEVLYGKESMTMNVHLLTHMVFCVKNLGPLWTQSMFSFESNNATFSRYVKGCNDVVCELKTKYILDKSLLKENTPISARSDKLEYKSKIKLTSSELSVLSTIVNVPLDQNKLFQIYYTYIKNGERFTSLKYNMAEKSIDYVVEMKDKIVGKVKFYFEFNGMFYLLLQRYKYGNAIQHIQEITPTDVQSVYFAEEIEKKFIYITFTNYNTVHYITKSTQ